MTVLGELVDDYQYVVSITGFWEPRDEIHRYCLLGGCGNCEWLLVSWVPGTVWFSLKANGARTDEVCNRLVEATPKEEIFDTAHGYENTTVCPPPRWYERL
jgi:hypothetical protein